MKYPPDAFTRPLPIPPILEDKNPSSASASFELVARKGKKSFLGRKPTETYGYNGDFLGPTIRVSKGQKVNIKVNNALGEVTTVHWHGLHLPGIMDGGPHQIIQPGRTWNASFSINQQAGTFWYHPHPHKTTGMQVYKGLAGLIIIDDNISKKLAIPKDYGKNDIPLIIQDKEIGKDGSLSFETSIIYSRNGMFGDTVLINGQPYPRLEVANSKVRFRVLNGSNTRLYKLYLDDDSPFYQIATDGGFLGQPVELRYLEISPGERAELIVDFSKYSVGQSVNLESEGSPLLKFVVNKKIKDDINLPEKLAEVKSEPESAAVRTRKFVLRSVSGVKTSGLTINGKLFSLSRVDEKVKAGTTEIWEFYNPAGVGVNLGYHPMHIHGVHFQILSRNGKSPPLNERGYKDTLLLHPDETVRLIVKFEKYGGLYMYHCHMLEHEDAGMMAQFELN